MLLLQLIEINSFICINQIKGKGKGKFRQASNRCKRFIEAVKLANVDKIRESVTLHKESDIAPQFNGSYVLSPASDETKLFVETFSEISNLDDSGVSSETFSLAQN